MWRKPLHSYPRKSVLVLEDDELSRDIAQCILRGGGFDVICAREFFEAIHHVECGTKIDVAFVDVKMPSGTPNGVSFAQMARRSRPALKVVFTSGDTSAQDFMRFDQGEVFLCKPFRPHHLLEVVARAAV
jgi:CheY-like chemotaxis protein